MYQWWLKHRQDLASLATIVSTLIAIATFCGVTIHKKLEVPDNETPIVEYSIQGDNHNN